jgi:hypothetical protein
MHYLIRIDNLKGIEMIINALRNTGNIADSDLADGIEKYTLCIDGKEKVTQLKDMVVENKPERKCICRGFYKPNHCPVHGEL